MAEAIDPTDPTQWTPEARRQWFQEWFQEYAEGVDFNQPGPPNYLGGEIYIVKNVVQPRIIQICRIAGGFRADPDFEMFSNLVQTITNNPDSNPVARDWQFINSHWRGMGGYRDKKIEMNALQDELIELVKAIRPTLNRVGGGPERAEVTRIAQCAIIDCFSILAIVLRILAMASELNRSPDNPDRDLSGEQ